MTPLYSDKDFNQAKDKDLLPLQCKFCREIFYRTKHYIQDAKRPERSPADFCNNSCGAKYQHLGHRLDVTCLQCGITFSKRLGQIKKFPNHFCSQSCAATYHNQHKTQGTRRSKLEAWLETQLTTLYPALDIHFNRTDAIDAELDIYIPSLNLAFELNGIYHYEPIHGADKLERVHANDHRKMLACAEQDIELCVIDNSAMLNFKEKKAQRFLDIIVEVITRNSALGNT